MAFKGENNKPYQAQRIEKIETMRRAVTSLAPEIQEYETHYRAQIKAAIEGRIPWPKTVDDAIDAVLAANDVEPLALKDVLVQVLAEWPTLTEEILDARNDDHLDLSLAETDRLDARFETEHGYRAFTVRSHLSAFQDRRYHSWTQLRLIWSTARYLELEQD